jgi:glutamate-1-semialdehyde 2,1-aminomutase
MKTKQSYTQKLYQQARRIMPGGTQLFSKRPELYAPGLWPAYYSHAKGCTIWDLDHKKFIDMSNMGVGSCILGYACPKVNESVKRCIDAGSMASLNVPEEVSLAKLLCTLHPWAAMARFSRGGGEAMAIAVRVARAFTGKETILFCGYHGWHDWYLAANLGNTSTLDGHLLSGLSCKGIPRELKGTMHAFTYNDIDMFRRLLKTHSRSLAAVVMEPVRSQYPKPGFLETIRELTSRNKIPLIFDEVTAGFRISLGGSHMKFGVYPDMAVFAKALGNGYPISAIIGRRNIMDSAQETFISSTCWSERIGPVAAIATIMELSRIKVYQHLINIGSSVRSVWQDAAHRHALRINLGGIEPLSHFAFDYPDRMLLKTLFGQLMLSQGFLASTTFYASYAHTKSIVKTYGCAVDNAFQTISKAISSGNPRAYLKGPVCQHGFGRLA